MQERLQKIIAAAGIASRRKAEAMILQGLVSVNGQVVTELGSKADFGSDHIRVSGKLLKRSGAQVCLLLNKPVGVVSTVSDPEGRPTVASLMRKLGVKERLYPVGRLDFNSSGLLLMTNDGELANHLMSRRTAVPRTYRVKLDGIPAADDLKKLEAGIALDGRPTAPSTIRPVGAQKEKPWYEITLVEGRYHQVRRMFERVGHRVVKLKRVRIAFLVEDGLQPGRARRLTEHEMRRLKHWRPASGHPEARPRNKRPRHLT